MTWLISRARTKASAASSSSRRLTPRKIATIPPALEAVQPSAAQAGAEEKNPFLVALGDRVRALRARRGMTRKAKALLIGTVTAIMLPGFILMDKVPVGRAIMAIVWVGHIVYFGFKVQTITQQEADDAMAQALEE